MGKQRQYLFLDVEASSLGPHSYPIEVAWSSVNEGDEPHCWLIDPYCAMGWDDWDPVAQGVHGISRAQLRAQGVDPSLVAAHMNAKAEGKVLYCDGGEFDIFWLDRLFEAAGTERRFRIGDARHLFHQLLDAEPGCLESALGLLAEGSTKDTVIEELAVKARECVDGKQHRAAVDVQYLECLYGLICSWSGRGAI